MLPTDIEGLIKTFLRRDTKESMKLCLVSIESCPSFTACTEGNISGVHRYRKLEMIWNSRYYKKLQRLGVEFSPDLQAVRHYDRLKNEAGDLLYVDRFAREHLMMIRYINLQVFRL